MSKCPDPTIHRDIVLFYLFSFILVAVAIVTVKSGFLFLAFPLFGFAVLALLLSSTILLIHGAKYHG